MSPPSPVPPLGDAPSAGGASGGAAGGSDDGRAAPGFDADRLAALILAACVLFNPPVLRAFGVQATVLGWPLIWVYIFLVWAAVIVCAALLLDRRGGG